MNDSIPGMAKVAVDDDDGANEDVERADLLRDRCDNDDAPTS